MRVGARGRSRAKSGAIVRTVKRYLAVRSVGELSGVQASRGAGCACRLDCRALHAPPRQCRRGAAGPGVGAGCGGQPADGGAVGLPPATRTHGGDVGDGEVRDAAGATAADRFRPASDHVGGRGDRQGLSVRGDTRLFATDLCPGLPTRAAIGLAGWYRGSVPALRRSAERVAARQRRRAGPASRCRHARGGVQRSFPCLRPLLGGAASGLRTLPGAHQGKGRARRGLCEAQRHRGAEFRLLGGARSPSGTVDARAWPTSGCTARRREPADREV